MGVAIAMRDDTSDAALDAVWDVLHETRPTAINLRWALDEMRNGLRKVPVSERAAAAYQRAADIAEEDVQLNRSIGANGQKVIREIAARKKPGEPVNILTHCNAGWLATVGLRNCHRANLHGGGGGHSGCMSMWTRRARATRVPS